MTRSGTLFLLPPLVHLTYVTVCGSSDLLPTPLASDCEQAGQTLQVQNTVRPTPNPNFLRVDARVFKQAEALFQLTTVMGRN